MMDFENVISQDAWENLRALILARILAYAADAAQKKEYEQLPSDNSISGVCRVCGSDCSRSSRETDETDHKMELAVRRAIARERKRFRLEIENAVLRERCKWLEARSTASDNRRKSGRHK